MGFLSVDGTFWIQLINFGIFFFAINAVFLRPVSKGIAERRAYIDGIAGDYERYRGQIKKLDEEAARLGVDARREAAELVTRARTEAVIEAESIRADYAKQAEEIVEKARVQLREETAQADAKRSELAASLADTLLNRALSESERAA
jgi:F0F1-type ATP synthase membrane subunit b/b'